MTVDTTIQPVSIANEDTTPSMRNIGIELEYPIANNPENPLASDALRSGDLPGAGNSRFDNGENGWALPGFTNEKSGYMGTDHTGAEVTSGILDLHTDEPERWYTQTIDQAQEMGYPFAANGCGDTNFGCHYHLSELSDEQADAINDVTSEEWGVVFFTASLSETSLDPWRHGGTHALPGNSCFERNDRRGYTGHYEFRLPEPVHPEHFCVIMDFLREISHDNIEQAREMAREAVLSCDDRLTPFKQYEALSEQHGSEWPNNACFEGDRRTDENLAEYFYSLVE